jgi:hypothetical protein
LVFWKKEIDEIMIRFLSARQNRIAFFLWAILYLECLLPAYASLRYGAPGKGYVPAATVVSKTSNRSSGPQVDMVRAPQNKAIENDVVRVPRSMAVEKGELRAPRTMASRSFKQPGGPSQPEMSSFQSVNAGNMVDLFTGDFSYNIPLLDVGGYPVNIHYSGGISMDQEASWVGLGWNINPGTIGRSMRGLPDEFNGTDKVTRTQSILPNKTVGGKIGAGWELSGTPIGGSASVGLFYNNYNGWGITQNFNAGINAGFGAVGSMTAGLGISNNSQTGLDVSPSFGVQLQTKNNQLNFGATLSTNFNSRTGISGLSLNTQIRKASQSYFLYNVGGTGTSMNSFLSFATASYTPTISMPYTNKSFSFSAKPGAAGWFNHVHADLTGYGSEQRIADADKIQSLPAFGYMNSELAKNTPKALMDFNREKEVQFDYDHTPNIAIPSNTYDLFTISGEGVGGMFRPQRSDVGVIRDHFMRTKSESDQFSVDFGAGALFHGGVELSFTDVNTQTNEWLQSNPIKSKLDYTNNDSTYRAVYFKNPAEKMTNTEDYINKIGGEELVRVAIDYQNAQASATKNEFTVYQGGRPERAIPVTTPIIKQKRESLTQSTTALSGAEAQILGIEKQIRSYKNDIIPVGICAGAYDTISRVDNAIRKPHHQSEMTVLGGDGRRYIYGIPAYNTLQKDVTFSVAPVTDANDLAAGLVAYGAGDNTTANDEGKENYFQSDEMPAYAHSYLLTSLLSPDYVDLRGDGISDDDIGDAVKFNYNQTYGGLQNNHYKWRTPFQQNKANYNEGLRTYKRDDKGTYMYGEKEIWYLHSIETKSMIAVFRLSSRSDAFSVLDENGGLDQNKSMKKLDRIDLYTKSELLARPTNPRPVKSVHFVYNYRLCKNAAQNSTLGKLTLDSIYFSYNGNFKGKRNPYVFRYGALANGNSDAALNPDYNGKNYDRWGNFKTSAQNPFGISNTEYPYAIQDKTVADKNAAVWMLNEIHLPSGGRMRVSYESDDYGYVQNKRASQMFSIAGFGNNTSGVPGNKLYGEGGRSTDMYYVYVNSATPLSSTQDVYKKYLEGIEDIYFKLAVKMPADRWGSGFEYVPTYGKIDSYGVVPGNNNRFWIKLKPVDGQSPITLAAIQFLRLNLPSKAYPTSEMGDNPGVWEVLEMFFSFLPELLNMTQGFGNVARDKGKAKFTDNTLSLVRLNNPNYKKLGGGYRVKKVEVFDNWNAMTQQKEAVYGQEYTYTTQQVFGKDTMEISSGVASYEPQIGGDENPFRKPIQYEDQVAPLAPTNYMYSETPLMESYFPNAMVGYSKVRVRTINTKTKSANGWQESEFFTTKDFPTIVDYTPLDVFSKSRYNPSLRNFLRIDAAEYITLSQGFKIELNDMNGKPKSEANYAENDPVNPIAYSRNFYKVDNDTAAQPHLNNRVWAIDSLNGHVNKNKMMGEDIELIVDMREQSTRTVTNNISPGIDIIPLPFLIPFLVVPHSIPIPQHEFNRYRSVATVKVINRYGILDSVVAYDKGSIVSTKNLAYDGKTGEVLLTRTQNEFNDPVYNFNYPAHWAYSGMGMASENIHSLIKNKFVVKGRMFDETPGRPLTNTSNGFESGDELWVNGTSTYRYFQYPLLGNTLVDSCGTPFFPIDSAFNGRLWVIDATKMKYDSTATKVKNQSVAGLFLIDKDGNPFTGKIYTAKIIRSGKRNMLNASIGSVMSLANPIRLMSGGLERIVLDSNSRVINTAATKFKDLWKVENNFYTFDSCYRKLTTKVDSFTAVDWAVVRRFEVNGIQFDNTSLNKYNAPALIAGRRWIYELENYPGIFFPRPTRSADWKNASVLKFDLATIPTSATVNSALLKLFPRPAADVWVNQPSFLNNSPYYEAKVREWRGDTVYAQVRASLGQNLPGTPCDNTFYLERFLGAWNGSTINFDNLPLRHNASRVTVSGNPANILTANNIKVTEVKSLIAPIVQNPINNYGMLMGTVNLDCNYGNSYTTKQSFYPPGCGCLQCRQTGSNLKGIPGSWCGLPNCPPQTNLPDMDVNCTEPRLVVNYSYYKDTCIRVCRPYMDTTKAVNPYVWGILGNWRPDRAFTFFGPRKQATVGTGATNIRTDGELRKFIPYWTLNNSGLSAETSDTVWVWNSALSMQNKRGLELENYDALNRYNAGQYGYLHNVPVAIAQNAKYREVFSDGFEDYSFKTSNCDSCASIREIDLLRLSINKLKLDNTQSHTGYNSVKVLANDSATISFPVVSKSNDEFLQYISGKVDSTAIFNKIVVGKGTGLYANYQGYAPGSTSCINGPGQYNPYNYTVSHSNVDTMVRFTWAYNGPYSNMCNQFYMVNWQGSIQARYTDTYYFTLNTGGGIASIAINGVIYHANYPNQSFAINLTQGAFYTVDIQFLRQSATIPNGVNGDPATVNLQWKCSRHDWQSIPKSYLYTRNAAGIAANPADSVGSVLSNIRFWCTSLQPVRVKNAIRPSFSPLQNKNIIASVWVKYAGNDCNYVNMSDSNHALITFNVPGNATATARAYRFKKTGVRIEGWQRYETDNIAIPATANSIRVRFIAKNSARDAYYDDLRIQPFNSGMKTFVYDPVNLRLMSELDENNYASFYEYDDDGTLIRVLKETVRGVKAIKETRSALKKE